MVTRGVTPVTAPTEIEWALRRRPLAQGTVTVVGGITATTPTGRGGVIPIGSTSKGGVVTATEPEPTPTLAPEVSKLTVKLLIAPYVETPSATGPTPRDGTTDEHNEHDIQAED